MDGGGVRWSAKAIWGGTYSSGGVRKVAINYVGWTTNRAGALARIPGSAATTEPESG